MYSIYHCRFCFCVSVLLTQFTYVGSCLLNKMILSLPLLSLWSVCLPVSTLSVTVVCLSIILSVFVCSHLFSLSLSANKPTNKFSRFPLRQPSFSVYSSVCLSVCLSVFLSCILSCCCPSLSHSHGLTPSQSSLPSPFLIFSPSPSLPSFHLHSYFCQNFLGSVSACLANAYCQSRLKSQNQPPTTSVSYTTCEESADTRGKGQRPRPP
jgi:hypothetical protein